MSEYAYERMRRVGFDDGEGGVLQFVPVCDKCGRLVSADKTVKVNGFGELSSEPNATCKKCGRVNMIFEGYF